SDEEDEEEKPAAASVVGPQLPTKEYRRILPLFRDRREELGHGSSSYRHESASKSKSSSAEEDDMLEIRSSMSESEKERIEIENRKRRINRTKRMVRENRAAGAKEGHPDSDEEEKKEIARKIKLKMKKALRQT
ncbi:hypothetical protein OESDEN_20637, partial [Oesophagostomum dentatum]